MTRFTLADLHASGLTCGPASLAAICDLTLDEVRPHFPGFRGRCNPTMMLAALRSAGRAHDVTVYSHGYCAPSRTAWPRYGLARIQWEGPWLQPGVNPRAACRYTHWVAVARGEQFGPAAGAETVFVWDINAVSDPFDGWLIEPVWSAIVVPRLTADIKRATGGRRITHAIEVGR